MYDSHPSGSATNIGSPSGYLVSDVLLLEAHGLLSAGTQPRAYLPKHSACNRSYVYSSAGLLLGPKNSHDHLPPNLSSLGNFIFRQPESSPVSMKTELYISQTQDLRGDSHSEQSLQPHRASARISLHHSHLPSVQSKGGHLRLSLRIKVPQSNRACTVAGEECSKPTADRHALPSRNNRSPLGSTIVSSDD